MVSPPQSSSPAIWTYWDDAPGTSRSGYLQLCEESMRRHAGSLPFRIVSIDDAEAWIGTLRPEVHHLRLAQRADYVRSRLLHQHGGVWVDADTIALRDIGEFFELLRPDEQLLGYGEDGVHIGVFAAQAGSQVLEAWAAAQDDVIDNARHLGEIPWTALGSVPLEVAVTKHPWQRVDHRRIAPVRWQDWRVFLSVTSPVAPVLEADPYFIALYNARLDAHLNNVSPEQILRSRTLLGRLLRIGCGLDSPSTPESTLTRFKAVGQARRHLRQRSFVRRRDRMIRREAARRRGEHG